MSRSAGQSARQVANSRPFQIGARIGILAYGITHILIGVLAVQVALGSGGQQANQSGAFQALVQQPFGRILLWVLVIGFVAIALWRVEQAIWGFTYVTDRTKNIRKRAESAGKAVLFAVLAVLAGRTASGGGGGGGGGQGATAGVLGLPGGQFIVGAVGIGILVVGGVLVVEGVRRSFREDMNLPSDRKARETALRTGQVGFIAKGVSIGLVGLLVVVAAVRFSAEQAMGLDAALKALAGQPFGPYLLIAVALGLVAFGVFCFFDARYHRL
jgi:hypothetical protein